MSLVKSISGIRGTIGGRVGEGLNPVDIVRFTGLNEYYSLESKEDEDGNKYTPVVFNSEKDVVTLGIR